MSAKGTFLKFARVSGVNRLGRALRAKHLVVLCYHSVVSDDFAAHSCRTRVAVSESQFREQLRTISRMYHPVAPEQVLSAVQGGPLPPRAVLVTFDDGFRNNLTRAVRVLEQYGVPALFHVTTGYVGRSELLWPDEVNERVLQWPHPRLPLPENGRFLELPSDDLARSLVADRIREACKSIPDVARQEYLEILRQESLPELGSEMWDLYQFLTWDDIRQMDRRGFTIGAHTISHPILTQLPDAARDHELTESKRVIEQELNKPCRWIAYPNGGRNDFSRAVTAAASAAGYEAAFTLLGGTNRLPLAAMEIDRVCVVRDLTPDAFQARLSGLAGLYHRVVC